jgi:hypothetical protein
LHRAQDPDQVLHLAQDPDQVLHPAHDPDQVLHLAHQPSPEVDLQAGSLRVMHRSGLAGRQRPRQMRQMQGIDEPTLKTTRLATVDASHAGART